MNLTLRTLLAWLDDTLPPNQVREIGKQVAEIPFATDLKEKIGLVTRQRRLTVPSSTGADAVDANIVASYLDNELDPERVVEYEKKCLTSDVHLAEVASVHQILSLIGQKAKVPVEARHRMYHLVKGREATTPKSRRGAKVYDESPLSEPVQPWAAPEAPRRPWVERLGPLAVLALMAVLCWSAWKSLTPPPLSPADQLALNPPPVPEKPAAPVPTAPAEAAKAKEASPPATSPELASTEAPATKPETVAEGGKPKAETPEAVPPGPEGQPKKNVPAGSIGQVLKTTGVVLKYNADQLSNEGRQWVRVEPKTPIKNQDRILSLAPYRTTLELGAAQVEMVGECEVWTLSSPPAQAARFNLAQGRVVVHGANPAAPIEVQFAGRTLVLKPPAGGLVGLERLNRAEAGAPASGLRVIATEGDVELKVDDSEEKLTGPGALTFRLPGHWTDRNSDPAPSWVTNPTPSALHAQTGDELLKHFRPGHAVVHDLVEALEDDSKDVRRLAISALRAMGDISYVVTELSKKEDPAIRRAAIDALRTYLTQGPDSARVLHKELVQEFGDDDALKVEKLLIGFTAKEVKDEPPFANLVQLLSTTDERLVGLRELALDNLQTLTGRDDLGYAPDKPEGKGLKAWKDLLRDNELRPPATAKAKK